MGGKYLLPFSAERRRRIGIAGGRRPIEVELTARHRPSRRGGAQRSAGRTRRVARGGGSVAPSLLPSRQKADRHVPVLDAKCGSKRGRAGSAGHRDQASGLMRLLCGQLNRVDDALIAGAPAEVARTGPRGSRRRSGSGLSRSSAVIEVTKPGVQKPHCSPWHSRSAACTGDSSPSADGDALDRGDLLAVGLDREDQAGRAPPGRRAAPCRPRTRRARSRGGCRSARTSPAGSRRG